MQLTLGSCLLLDFVSKLMHFRIVGMGTSEEATDDFPVELFTILVSTFGLVLGCRSTHTLAMPYQKLLTLGFCQQTDAFQDRGHGCIRRSHRCSGRRPSASRLPGTSHRILFTCHLLKNVTLGRKFADSCDMLSSKACAAESFSVRHNQNFFFGKAVLRTCRPLSHLHFGNLEKPSFWQLRKVFFILATWKNIY